jgi:uncharacterized protein
MLDVLNGFVTELRAAGIPVSLTESLDSMAAVKEIPLEDRLAFKAALGCTLVKNQAHYRAFETVFEVYFSLRTHGPGTGDGDMELSGDNAQQQSPDRAASTGSLPKSWPRCSTTPCSTPIR